METNVGQVVVCVVSFRIFPAQIPLSFLPISLSDKAIIEFVSSASLF